MITHLRILPPFLRWLPAAFAISLAHGYPAEESGHITMHLGERQDLLSPAAAYAIEKGDLRLLKSLRTAGWDPSLPMRFHVITRDRIPLTYAAEFGQLEITRWLIETCGISPGARDGSNDRAIEATMDFERQEIDESCTKVVEYLKRDGQPTEAGAIRELACSFPWPGRFNITINRAPPDKEFTSFPKWLKEEALRSERYHSYVLEFDKLGKDAQANEVPQSDEPRKLEVDWEKVNDREYQFLIATESGGSNGVIRFRFGYWITTVKESWDV